MSRIYHNKCDICYTEYQEDDEENFGLLHMNFDLCPDCNNYIQEALYQAYIDSEEYIL